MTTSVVTAAPTEGDNSGDVGAGLHHDLPRTSFSPWEGEGGGEDGRSV